MNDHVHFPCNSPPWFPPPPAADWWDVQSIRTDKASCFNDVLVAVALALRRQGPSQRVTLFVALKEIVQMTFPSQVVPLAEWRPELDASDARAFLALDFKWTPSHELVERAESFRVPVVVSLDDSRSCIQVVYDKVSVGRAQVSWFLVHIKNALRNLQQASSPLVYTAESFLLSHNISRLLPSSMVIRVANILWRLRNHGARLYTDVPLMCDAELALMDDIATLRFQYERWVSKPSASTVHGHFLECARATPLADAFRLYSERKAAHYSSIIDISYSSSHTIAANLAMELRSFGVCPNAVVPLVLDDPMEISLAMVAVMLLGAAYTIIDPKELDLTELQKSMNFGRAPSSIVLVNQHNWDSVKLPHLKFVDPRDVIEVALHESVHSLGSMPFSDLPTVVESDLAFISHSGESPSRPLFVTHRDASELLHTCMHSHRITSTSKVLFMNDCSSWLLHGIIWNIFALGGMICSMVGHYEADLAQILCDVQCTHICLPTRQVPRLSSVLLQNGWVHGGSSRTLHTLIVSDDLSFELRHQWEDSPFAGTVDIIKYGNVSAPETITTTATVDDTKIHIIYQEAGGVDITPEQVLELLPSGTVLYEAMGRKVIKISATLVAKCGASAAEVHNMNFVRAHTDIPVPCTYLLFDTGHRSYAVMEYLDGDTLEVQWDSLEETRRTSVVEQLGGYLCQLRALENPSSVPGPVDGGPCCGRWFGLFDAGPFATHEDLVAWLNRKRDARRNNTHEPFTTEGYRLVFTHQDLAPRNMILDKSGRLWLLDWEFAGWYPSYFEYACVMSSVLPIPKDLLRGLLPYLGPYEREYRSLDAIMAIIISSSSD
ncbi:hypothetical protein Hypma_014700 [Hypsizygus marmoreus]|uniref:Aminoglycoside phosphotransferase domain-containing protein n=1 Tax=Hypsizygus marmoreus TaxID=39966 RepID=A0A369J9V8_HYPMA|nr:hypothetical protein Hypma_014700 [Hypsizygus marmoreus]